MPTRYLHRERLRRESCWCSPPGCSYCEETLRKLLVKPTVGGYHLAPVLSRNDLKNRAVD